MKAWLHGSSQLLNVFSWSSILSACPFLCILASSQPYNFITMIHFFCWHSLLYLMVGSPADFINSTRDQNTQYLSCQIPHWTRSGLENLNSPHPFVYPQMSQIPFYHHRVQKFSSSYTSLNVFKHRWFVLRMFFERFAKRLRPWSSVEAFFLLLFITKVLFRRRWFQQIHFWH